MRFYYKGLCMYIYIYIYIIYIYIYICVCVCVYIYIYVYCRSTYLETEYRLFPPVTKFLDLFLRAGYFFNASD